MKKRQKKLLLGSFSECGAIGGEQHSEFVPVCLSCREGNQGPDLLKSLAKEDRVFNLEDLLLPKTEAFGEFL